MNILYKLKERKWDKSFLGFSVFIRANEIETIAKHHGWDDIDYSQIKSMLDDLSKMTVGLIDCAEEESSFDIDIDDKCYQYLKQCDVLFEKCSLCFFKEFKILHKERAYRNMIYLTVDRDSFYPFFELLREKYDTRLITLVQGFAFIEFVIDKKNIRKIEKYKNNHESTFYDCNVDNYMIDEDLDECLYSDYLKSLID